MSNAELFSWALYFLTAPIVWVGVRERSASRVTATVLTVFWPFAVLISLAYSVLSRDAR